MGNSSDDAIASYFADLLTEAPETQANDAPLVSAEPHTAKLPRRELGTGTALPRPGIEPTRTTSIDTALETLEQHKKQQLQALLNSQLLIASPEPVPVPVPVPVSVRAPSVPKSLKKVAQVKPEVADPVDQVLAPSGTSTSKSETRAINEYLAWADNGRPLWAQKPFDILLFQVAGLNLAVPLIALGHIHPITDELAPVFGQLDWFMGFQPTAAGAIRTVNTALFVMPERYEPKFAQEAKYVISIDGMDWGLAVDGVRNPSTLQPEDVTWRSQRTKRPWLAGTVKSAMCALLDIPQMGHLLQSHDRNRSKSQ